MSEIQSIGHLECQNENCKYQSPEMSRGIDDFKSLVGEVCPQCSEILFNTEDLEQISRVFEYLSSLEGKQMSSDYVDFEDVTENTTKEGE
jgi:hypothetical protein